MNLCERCISTRANTSANLQASLHGHSIGHFGGETLMIDTVGYLKD